MNKGRILILFLMKIAIKIPWCYICPDKNPGQRENFSPVKLIIRSRRAV